MADLRSGRHGGPEPIFYVLRGGISWRLIPKDLPPRSTTFGYFSRWRDTGCLAGSTTTWSWPIASESDGKPHRLPRSSTAKASRRRRAAARAATMPARGSRAQAPSAGRHGRARARPRSSAADVQDRDGAVPVLACRVGPSRSSPKPSPMQAMPATDRRPPRSSRSRSCASRPIKSALPCIHAAGWSNASSPGSAVIAASGRTRGDYRLGQSIPLRSSRHDPRQATGPLSLTSRTDS